MGYSRVWASAVVLLAVAVSLASPAYAGVRQRHVVVLFDESHRPMTSAFYGDAVEPYLYRKLVKLLEDEGFTVKPVPPGSNITRSVLDGAGILVVMPGRRPYGPGEVEAIVSWVRDGGSLLLLGDYDHYPANLRLLAERLGVVFLADRFNGTRVLMNIAQNSSYTRFVFYPVFMGDMLNHSSPLLEGIHRVEMYSATALRLPGNATVLIRAADDAAWYDSYHGRWGPPAPRAPVMAWFRYGKGVVVVVGDINLWSDPDIDGDGVPSLYDSDNYKLAVNVFSFLAGRGGAAGASGSTAAATASATATASSTTASATAAGAAVNTALHVNGSAAAPREAAAAPGQLPLAALLLLAVILAASLYLLLLRRHKAAG